MAIAPALFSTMQSALAPAGREAELMADIFVWMAAGAALIWAAVMLLAWYAPRASEVRNARIQTALIVGGGVVFPVVVLLALMVSGLGQLPAILAPPRDRSLSLEISGSQWWWRVRYLRPGREPIELANEIRLPVGRRIDAALKSVDVIHSFWVPSIAGKMDMIPGRINRIACSMNGSRYRSAPPRPRSIRSRSRARRRFTSMAAVPATRFAERRRSASTVPISRTWVDAKRSRRDFCRHAPKNSAAGSRARSS
jgi:hypothetical protein